MSEIMTPIPMKNLVRWTLEEYKNHGTIFGINKNKFYKNESGTSCKMFGEALSTPIGPAAGPNSQLTQNIVASYLTGSRFVELKTVQKMDGEELRHCVPRPCINAQDEGYNVEWSTELKVEEAFNEYVKAWFLIHVIAKELGLSENRDFAFNMSVGYDLEGISSPKIDKYIMGMKDASNTAIWQECVKQICENLDMFKNVTKEYVSSISPHVSPSITLSTLHGCPPAEIERIATYLITQKGLHTYIKCNPTLLGYDFARNILDDMGYGYLTFDSHHFDNDLQYSDAVPMITRLQELAKLNNVDFGVKITNTFPVEIHNNELPGKEMYMSGRSLFPLSISVADKLSQSFGGNLPISYSGGADAFNIEQLVKVGIRPITVATTILKPGGYERICQLAKIAEPALATAPQKVDFKALHELAANVRNDKHLVKKARPVASRKTKSNLPLTDCYKAPCKDGGCPIEQQIPEYLKLVSEKRYGEAFAIIAIDNANPAITGTICDHQCQFKCTRLDYEESLEIRNAKKLAVEHSQKKFIENMIPSQIKTNKKVAIIGAGSAGVSTALFLRRCGVEVTVFEKRERPFGIVEYIIPEFRIPRATIEMDYQMAVKAGVNFVFNVKEDYNIAALKEKFDFVVVATGAWKESLPAVKEGVENTTDALDFLLKSKANNCKVELGRRVAVIGGGDVACDCSRAAKRAPGVDEVVIVYRRTKDFMPAEPEEIESAEHDDIKFATLLAPVSYVNGQLVCEKMQLGERDASGRRGVVGTGVMETMQFDTVIAAVGARVDTSRFIDNGMEMTDRGYPKLSAGNETSIENVYIAGDCKSGTSTIVKAIADGKVVAKDILAKLGLAHDFVTVPVVQSQSVIDARKSDLCDGCLSEQDGERCLVCDQVCEICCDVCPNRANVTVKVDGFSDRNQIVHLDGMCNECGNCGIFCPHIGNPYKDKITLFWSKADFTDSTNAGFLPIGGDKFEVRTRGGEIFACTRGDGKMPNEMALVLDALLEQHSYYFV